MYIKDFIQRANASFIQKRDLVKPSYGSFQKDDDQLMSISSANIMLLYREGTVDFYEDGYYNSTLSFDSTHFDDHLYDFLKRLYRGKLHP